MKVYLIPLYILVLIFMGITTNAQDKTDLNPPQDFTYETHQGSIEKTETTSFSNETEPTSFQTTTATGSAYGNTYGKLDVSSNGSASYTVPIAVPPGIDGVIPNIAIGYNSQASHGMAGYGWNIAGLSTITRLPATQYHDGVIDPVDFDNLDRFALDGQRLILKSGTYGADGAIYETENYSNIRITSYGVSPYGAAYGPAYFLVQYPDASKAYYGLNSNSRSRLEYAVTYTENPQGIRINYSYDTTSNPNLITIKSITYGAKGSATPINEIRFEYIPGYRSEISYVNGIRFIKKTELDQIKVIANGTGYRNYQVNYDHTSAGIRRLTRIIEKNGNNTQQRNAIQLGYSNTEGGGVSHQLTNTNLGVVNIEQRNAGVMPLDLTGNGEMDFIVYPKDKNKLWVFKRDRLETAYTINMNKFEHLFPTTWLNHNNKILPGQGFTVVENSGTSQVQFKVFSDGVSTPIAQQYTKTWNGPTYFTQDSCDDLTIKRIPQEYVSGDFNGDGLTDVLAIGKTFNYSYCSPIPDCGDGKDCCDCEFHSYSHTDVNFINLDRRITTGFSSTIGKLRNRYVHTDRIQTADVNGDGKTDLLHFTHGKVTIYNLDNNNKLQRLWETTDTKINSNLPIMMGDYNGDGKTDFMTPHAQNSSTFYIFESAGNRFYRRQADYNFQYKVSYNTQGTAYGYNLIPVDINGDGKTDIIEYNTTTYDNSSNGTQQVKLYHNLMRGNSSTYVPIFYEIGRESYTGQLKHYPIPIFLSSKQPNRKLEFATISNKWVSSFLFSRDLRQDGLLTRITNGGTQHRIAYNNMAPSDNYHGNVYQSNIDQEYPYVSIGTLPGVKLVREISRTSLEDNATIKRTFFYKGGVAHAGGLGFVGFQYTAESNWHTDAADRIFTNYTNDPQLHGTVIDEYQTPYTERFGQIPSDYLVKTKYNYGHNLSSKKVFKLWATSTVTENQLEGTTTTSHYLYDPYLNPTQETVNYSGQGSTVVNNTYSQGLGSSYYIGRLMTQKTTSTIGGDYFNSEVQYTYNRHQVHSKKTAGNNTAWDIESYSYDTYGNLLQSTIAPDGASPRTLKYTYDSSGRFVKKSTNILGQETNYQYNTSTGMLTKTINPYGQATTNEYDSWNRLTKMTDFLGNSTITTYSASNYQQTVQTDGPDGSSVSMTTDQLGRKINQRNTTLGGNWTQVTYEYDALDRLIKQSEPHFGNAPSQWNTTNYDLYGRVTRQSLYTGKEINYTYNGLTTTVNDGTKSVTTKRNALGNITRVDDPGGTITYTYFGNGNLKTSSYAGVSQTIQQDGWGRKTKLTDPSAGIYTYEYDGYGNVTKETTPKGNTTTTYDTFGRITQSRTVGDHTNMTTNYAYDNTTKLLKTISANDAINGRTYSYLYGYDTHKRPRYVVENIGNAEFEINYQYDNLSRVKSESYRAQVLGGGDSSTSINYEYDTYGTLIGFDDWTIKGQNARGQITDIKLSTGGTETMEYDNFGYLKKNAVKAKDQRDNYIENNYTFNARRGFLTNRSHYSQITGTDDTYNETFTYDTLDRLKKIEGPKTNNKDYDPSGRVTADDDIGYFSYNSGNQRYQLKSINLHQQGLDYYISIAQQAIEYNAHKKPVEVFVNQGGRVSFEYGPMRNRTQAWYGGPNVDKEDRKYHKLYSSIIPAEIVHNKDQNNYKYVFFKGGDAYSAPVASIETVYNGNASGHSTYHLQRDYLGSILNITKQVTTGTETDGVLMESRIFGAWGTVDKFFSRITQGATMGHDSILDRGFTGHEHFFDVGLIHMNGRMYDPKLGRFLSPDNVIQNPYNTQNYNRYSYVLNNPLSYTDPSGENYEDPVEGGGIPPALIGNGLATLFNTSGAGDWFTRNVLKTKPFKWIGNLFKRKKRHAIIETPQLRINSDPLMNPSPTVPSVFTSNGMSFGEQLLTAPLHLQAGIFQQWKGAAQGLAQVVANPGSLFTVEAFQQRAIMAVDFVTGRGVPGMGIVGQIEKQQAIATGDIGVISQYYGRQIGLLQMEALSLIAGARGFSSVGNASKAVNSRAKTWNQFQKMTAGQFKTRAQAAAAWSLYKSANGIVTGTVRSQSQKALFLKNAAASRMYPKWMNQWLQKGKVPPGYHVDHIIPLSIGGKDVISNMRLLDIDFHINIHHVRYRPWDY